jgi:uroporphyrinogen-III synthase
LREGEEQVREDTAKGRWERDGGGLRYVIATIGPTTRDHLINTFGFEPDVCAMKPSAEGVGDGIVAFLKEKRMVGTP